MVKRSNGFVIKQVLQSADWLKKEGEKKVNVTF